MLYHVQVTSASTGQAKVLAIDATDEAAAVEQAVSRGYRVLAIAEPPAHQPPSVEPSTPHAAPSSPHDELVALRAQVATLQAIMQLRTHVQTIEQTGKRYKGMMLSGLALALLGVLTIGMGVILAGASAKSAGGTSPAFAMSAFVAGACSLVGGLAMYFIARGLAWWHHG